MRRKACGFSTGRQNDGTSRHRRRAKSPTSTCWDASLGARPTPVRQPMALFRPRSPAHVERRGVFLETRFSRDVLGNSPDDRNGYNALWTSFASIPPRRAVIRLRLDDDLARRAARCHGSPGPNGRAAPRAQGMHRRSERSRSGPGPAMGWGRSVAWRQRQDRSCSRSIAWSDSSGRVASGMSSPQPACILANGSRSPHQGMDAGAEPPRRASATGACQRSRRAARSGHRPRRSRRPLEPARTRRAHASG